MRKRVGFLGGLKSFGILVATFAVVYFLTPLAVQIVIRWFPVAHPERLQNGLGILATVVVYNILRRALGQKMPPI